MWLEEHGGGDCGGDLQKLMIAFLTDAYKCPGCVNLGGKKTNQYHSAWCFLQGRRLGQIKCPVKKLYLFVGAFLSYGMKDCLPRDGVQKFLNVYDTLVRV